MADLASRQDEFSIKFKPPISDTSILDSLADSNIHVGERSEMGGLNFIENSLSRSEGTAFTARSFWGSIEGFIKLPEWSEGSRLLRLNKLQHRGNQNLRPRSK